MLQTFQATFFIFKSPYNENVRQSIWYSAKPNGILLFGKTGSPVIGLV